MLKIEYDCYLNLLASHIILDVLNKASKIIEFDSNSKINNNKVGNKHFCVFVFLKFPDFIF
jgi:hypothetical protein